MTINEFVKEWKKEFPNSEYKATGEGMVIKSRGWNEENDDEMNIEMPYSIVFSRNGKLHG